MSGITLNVFDNYWAIKTEAPGEVYQSKTNTMVTLDNPEYMQWQAWFGDPTPIGTLDELAEVLIGYQHRPLWLLSTKPTFIQPTPDSYTEEQLASYTALARDTRHRSGIVVNDQPFATDAITLGSLNSAHIYTQSNQGATFSWKLPDGSFITLDKAAIDKLQGAVASYGQACFLCEDVTLDKIEAGTVTTLEQIDAEFAAVNNVFTGLVADDIEVRHGSKERRTAP